MTIEIPLTKGYFAIVDDEDGDLLKYKWNAFVSRQRVYAVHKVRSEDGRQVNEFLHRVILSRIVNRALLSIEQCDHIRGNGLNNRRENLRVASYAQNRMNEGKLSNNTTGYKGVYLHRPSGKFQADIGENGNRHRLGYYNTAEEAHEAYKQAAIKYHGEFARFE